MKINFNALPVTRVALAAAAVLSAPAAFADCVATTYTTGDLVIGFRQSGVANTLAVDIGPATQYIPSSIAGGTWNGNPFNVTFGLVPAGNPGAGNTVFNLNADLSSNGLFGSGWATNNLTDSSLDVSWAIAGTTNTINNNSPINGLSKKSIFLTVARTHPNTIAPAPSGESTDLNTASTTINSFAQGSSGGAYKGRISTINSNKAYIGPSTDANNWGAATGTLGSTFGSGFLAEQPLTGPASGPTNSVLDLYLFPNTGSTLVTSPTYLGSFSLNSSGELNYSAVPEPNSYALFGLGVALVGLTRRTRRVQAGSPA